MTREPCAGCGRETAAGSTHFSERRRGVDRRTAEPVYVCAGCAADVTATGDRPSDSRLGIIELADIFTR